MTDLALDQFHGLTAILRGLTRDEAPTVGNELYGAGLRALEVPLNSPEPYASIEILRCQLPADCRVGAGTVLVADDVSRVREAGGEFVVSPDTQPSVIRATIELGLISVPGAATPTEALTAQACGAHLIKVFPAVQVGFEGVRAWRAVLPRDLGLIAVGGVEVDTIRDWVRVGVVGIGLGTALYRPGADPADIGLRAAQATEAWRRAVR